MRSSRRSARTTGEVLAARTAAGVFAHAVGEVERRSGSGECSVCTAVTCASFRQASPFAPARNAASSRRSAGGSRPGRRRGRRRTVGRVAGGEHRVVHELDLRRRIQPSPIVAMPSRRPACCRPVQWITGTRLKMPSKYFGVTLRHRQPFAPAFGAADEVELAGRASIALFHQLDRHVAHLLVRRMREVDERLVVEREHLRRLVRAGSGGPSRCRR